MAQIGTKHVRPMPLRLDNRDKKEFAIIQHYESVFVGRRNDFLRTCLIAGYEKLHGPITDKSSMFNELGGAVTESTVSGVRKRHEFQDNLDEKPPETVKSKPRLMGLIGNQE